MPRPLRSFCRINVLLVAFVLAACETPSPQVTFPEITFQHKPPIKLDVREVAFEQVYQPPSRPPNVDHLFPVRPAAAAMRWGRDRLRAAGSTGRARYVVREASVVEVPLKVEGGLKGVMTVDQSERYDARLVVDVHLNSDDRRSLGTVTVEVVRSQTAAEDLSLNEREKVWFVMTEALMRDFDAELEKAIKSAFLEHLIM